jgi:hypothetical protein
MFTSEQVCSSSEGPLVITWPSDNNATEQHQLQNTLGSS